MATDRQNNAEQAAKPLEGQISLEEFSTPVEPAAGETQADPTKTLQFNATPDNPALNWDNPALDPDNPEYDPALLKELEQSLELSAGSLTLIQTIRETLETSISAELLAGIQRTIDHINGFTELAGKALAEFYSSESYQRLSNLFTDLKDWAQALALNPDILSGIEALLPFLEQEVAELRLKPGYEDLTLDDVTRFIELDGTPITEIDGKPVDNVLIRAIERAKERQESAAAAEQFERELPRLQSLKPKNYVSPNTKLSNELQHDIIGAGEVNLIVSDRNKRNPIITPTNVTLENMDGVTFTGKPWTEYDRDVHDAVISFYVESKKRYPDKPVFFTPHIIYRVMHGKKETETPSPQTIGSITKSLEKMRRNIHVTADATEELRKRGVTVGGELIREFVIDDFILNIRRVTLKAGRNEVKGYKMEAEPILYQYGRYTNQLLSIRADLLDIKEVTEQGQILTISLPVTETRTAIRNYMLRRIKIMQHDAQNKNPQQSNIILFDTLFREAGIDTTSRESNRRNRDYAFNCLEYWKAAGFISDYKKQTKGNAITAMEIIL